MKNLQLIGLARHRNGVMGAPFYVVLFKDSEWPDYTFVATVFDDPSYISILVLEELNKLNITFGNGNSWRGDYYENDLRTFIEEEEEKQRQEDIKKAEKKFCDYLNIK